MRLFEYFNKNASNFENYLKSFIGVFQKRYMNISTAYSMKILLFDLTLSIRKMYADNTITFTNTRTHTYIYTYTHTLILLQYSKVERKGAHIHSNLDLIQKLSQTHTFKLGFDPKCYRSVFKSAFSPPF